MYSKKIEIGPPLARPRFLLISNYDKLLHVSVTFVVLAFLYPVSVLFSVIVVGGLQIGKEIFDYVCGDGFIAITGDLGADLVGWGLFFIYLKIW